MVVSLQPEEHLCLSALSAQVGTRGPRPDDGEEVAQVTDAPPLPLKVEWEPIAEGISLTLGYASSTKYEWLATMQSVRELRDDMEEASMLARGLEPMDIFVMEINDEDWLKILGDTYRVTSTLEQGDSWVIQFALNSHTTTTAELILPPDLQVTVWRPVGEFDGG